MVQYKQTYIKYKNLWFEENYFHYRVHILSKARKEWNRDGESLWITLHKNQQYWS